jgi:hypothetical protein
VRYCVAPTGLGDGGLADPQELRPGLASVAPSGLGIGAVGVLSWNLGDGVADPRTQVLG